MDPERVRAYLQVACAGLGFDIGEIWWTKTENGLSTVAAIEEPEPSSNESSLVASSKSTNNSSGTGRKRFVQLYTSHAYENRRCDLVEPPTPDNFSDSFNNNSSTERHVLSPRLVDAIAKTTQVVWANSKKQEGLIGRSDIKLQTAVGMPVAVDSSGNMCVVVMFSPNNIQGTDDAMEYLQSLSLSATSSSIPCLLPVIDPTSGAASGIHAHHHGAPDANAFGDGVTARFVSLDEHRVDSGSDDDNDGGGGDLGPELTSAPKDTFGIPMLPSFADMGNVTPEESIDIFDEASYGIWSTIMEEAANITDQLPPSSMTMINNSDSSAAAFAAASSTDAADSGALSTSMEGNTAVVSDPSMHVVLPFKSSMSESRKTRLEEFCHAFLDMSVFDLADVWVPANDAGYPDCLRLVTSVTSSDNNTFLNDFKSESVNTLIKFWTGAVGRAYSSGNPVWSANPNVFVDPGRVASFQRANIMTVLAVPVFSSKGGLPACVVSCYSLVRSGSVPFVLRFVQQALRLLWEGLDKVEPHESVGRNLWQDVAPADLGEMAADTEMQQHFMQKKRPHTMISSVVEEQQRPTADPVVDDLQTSLLSSHLETMSLPSGETITIPLQLTADVTKYTETPASVDVAQVHNHVYEAVRSVREAVPFADNNHVSTNAEGTKRSHVVLGPLPKNGHHPLTKPHGLPNRIVGAAAPTVHNGYVAPVVTQSVAPAVINPTASTSSSVFPHQQVQYGVPAVAQPPSIPSKYPASVPSAPMAPFAPLPTAASTTTANQLFGSTNFVTVLPSSSTVNGEKLCRIQGCDEPAAARRPYCMKHSGTRLCEHEGCKKCAQGSTRFCIAHGGGRRCTYPGCDKGARDKFFCAAHGGGKRCKHEGCSKSAVGGSNLCTAHGGGRRCSVEGCDKSAQSSTQFCVKHGGGKKCAHSGCTKVARGRTPFCAAHGGGVRCKLEGCNRVAIGKMQLCRAHGGGSTRKMVAVEPTSVAQLEQQQQANGVFPNNGISAVRL